MLGEYQVSDLITYDAAVSDLDTAQRGAREWATARVEFRNLPGVIQTALFEFFTGIEVEPDLAWFRGRESSGPGPGSFAGSTPD
jgi:hypothetical protein